MNFDKKIFSEILTKIKNTYGSINKMAEKTEITAAYLSKLIRLMYDNPPSPEILKKIADNSNGVISYAELMEVCGYLDAINLPNLKADEFLKHIDEFKNLGLSDSQIDHIFVYFIALEPDEKDEENFSIFLSTLDISVAQNIIDILKTMLQNTINIIKDRSSFYDDLLKRCEELKDNISISQKIQYYMCPVYGRIAAGQPNWAEECIEGRIPIDPELMNIINPEECYFLKINGESMNKVIKNGAFALIRKTDWVENGEIAVVLVNGFDATLKKITKQGNLVILEPMSTDPSFTTQVYDKNTEIKVVGKYIGKMEINN